MTLARLARAALGMTAVILLASPASAGKIEKTLPFELDHWYELGAADGPVTLHRIQIERQGAGGFNKSFLSRPGNTEFLESVRILIDYSNKDRHKDWKAHLDITWLDASGEVIDGYVDKETIDNDKNHDDIHVALSTLKYGIKKAKSLRVRITFEPE